MVSVLIVGAGASGITAGYDLKRAGVENVTILEATSLHGGRLRKLQGLANFPIDIGAEWIEVVSPSILDQIVNNSSVPVKVKTVKQVATPQFYVGNQFVYQGDQVTNEPMFVNYTWYDFFTDYIFPTVEKEIVFSCPVSKVDYSSSKPRVTSACGTFVADKVIVTASVAVLKAGDITFQPQLPLDKRSALAKVSMPPAMKVFMRFSEEFYPGYFLPASQAITYNSMFWNESYGEATSDHVLGWFCFHIGCNSYVGLSDDEILAKHLSDLDAKFNGKASASFIKGHVQNWLNEPYVKGGYSYYGAFYRLVDVLRTPLNNKVFLAGEHIPAPNTDYQHGFAWGAALSGREAVRLLLRGL